MWTVSLETPFGAVFRTAPIGSVPTVIFSLIRRDFGIVEVQQGRGS